MSLRDQINKMLFEDDRADEADRIRRRIKEGHMVYNLYHNARYRWEQQREIKDVEGEVIEDVGLLEHKE